MYVYRGTEFDADNRPKCGTRAAYQDHLAKGETPCAPCSKANTVYTTAHDKRRRGIYVGFTEEKCGTVAGFGSHKYHKVPVCEPCAAAVRAYQKAYKAARKAAA